MKYFVLSNNVITAVIASDLHLEQGSSKFIPTTKESLTTYNNWLATNPGKQPTLSDIYASKPAAKPAAKSTTNTATSVGKPLSEEEAKKKAMIKQFRHFMINR